MKQRRRARDEAPPSNSASGAQQRTHEIDSAVFPVVGDGGEPAANHGHLSQSHHYGSTLLMKIIGPVITFVDHPWKVSVVSIWHKS